MCVCVCGVCIVCVCVCGVCECVCVVCVCVCVGGVQYSCNATEIYTLVQSAEHLHPIVFSIKCSKNYFARPSFEIEAILLAENIMSY